MENIELTLQKDEKALINNILLENCMSMVDLLAEQKTEKNIENVLQVMQTTIACQHKFFLSCLEESLEVPEAMAYFVKPILEGALENLKEVKKKFIRQGDQRGFSVSSTCEVLSSLIMKFPNPSLIIKP